MARKLYEYMSPEASGVQIMESNDGKDLFMAGLFIQGDVKNQNGRVYPKDEIQKAVDSVKSRLQKGETVMGELDHPEELQINLDRVSHIITDMHCEDSNGLGKLKIIETPMGNIARGLLDGGANLGVSSRALGSLQMNKEGINVVQDDFMLSTAADIVADPSAPDAYVRGIMENKEWVFVDGKFVEKHIEEVKSFIKKTSSRNLEEAKLLAFQRFLSKIR